MARRPSTEKPFICVTCEAEITGPPTFHVGLPFCCGGCVASGPCTCSYDLEPTEDSRVRHCLDVETAVRDRAFTRADQSTLVARR